MMTHSVSRRVVLATAAAVLAGARPSAGVAGAIPGVPRTGNEIAFDIFGARTKIGFHDMMFGTQGTAGLTVRNRIDVAVSIAGVTLFYYRHHSTETYADGRLVGFVGQTDDDGDRFAVQGEAVADGFRSITDKGPVLAPADILVASYWNPAILTRKLLLDPQKGRVREQVVEHVEPRTVTVFGQPRQATAYRVAGIADGEIFYDDTGEWVGAVLVRRGTNVIYRRRV